MVKMSKPKLEERDYYIEMLRYMKQVRKLQTMLWRKQRLIYQLREQLREQKKKWQLQAKK